MRAPRTAVAAAAAVLALTASGCSASTDDEGTSETSPTRSGTKSDAPSSSASKDASSPKPEKPSPTGKNANCLFTVAQVSEVLGGAWERRATMGQACAYRSDRGAVFATKRVDDDIEGGLTDARDACMPGIKPIQVSKQTFVCVEDREPDDFVVGNTVSKGALWVAVIVPPDDSVPEAQISAMTALMGAVPN